MTTHYVPPKGERQVRIDQVEGLLKESLRPFIRGTKKLTEAVSAALQSITPLLSLPKEPHKGSTVMTEKASMERADKGKFFGKPQNL